MCFCFFKRSKCYHEQWSWEKDYKTKQFLKSNFAGCTVGAGRWHGFYFSLLLSRLKFIVLSNVKFA